MKKKYFFILMLVCVSVTCLSEEKQIANSVLDKSIIKSNKLLSGRYLKFDFNNFLFFTFLNNEYKMNNLIDKKKFIKSLNTDDYLEYYKFSGLIENKKCISKDCFDTAMIVLNFFEESIYSSCSYFNDSLFFYKADSFYNEYFLKQDLTYEMCLNLNSMLWSLTLLKKKLNLISEPNDLDIKISKLIEDRIIQNDSIPLNNEYKITSIAIYLYAGYYTTNISNQIAQILEMQKEDGSWILDKPADFTIDLKSLEPLQLKSYYRNRDRNTINAMWAILAYKKSAKKIRNE